ncbi:MAG: glycoside hydrolase family 15 protein [Patescibacteria group bacterium]
MLPYIQLVKNFFRIVKPNGDGYLDYKKIEHYGLIGNLETCALVAVNGSIDWLCLPHLESASVFASILDKDKGGFWVVQPKGSFDAHQKYLENTNVLQTFFKTKTGEAILTDFMPPFKKRTVWHKHQILFRKIECTKGVVSFIADFRPRFNYARTRPKLKLTDSGVVAATETEKLFLDAPFAFEIRQPNASTYFTLGAKESIWLTLQYNSHSQFTARQSQAELQKTVSYWRRNAHTCERGQCVFNGPWHELVVRSGLVLKLLTHGETGAIAAAATTSLPEAIGGERNWDYRFNWIRDSVLTAQALYNLGQAKEARELLNWYKRLYKGVKVQDIQIVYGLHGERDLSEQTLRHLSGYRNSRPVRIGNGAVKQRQLDIYGEMLNMAYEVRRFGEIVNKRDWRLLKKTVNYVCKVWHLKDAGIWEVRRQYQHFVYSKVMCWVALDRGIKIAERRQFVAPLGKWQRVREEIYADILKKGYNRKLNSFVQSYGSRQLDAANLLIPLVGFLPYEDERVQGTIKATLKQLTKKGLVRRYLSRDGLSGSEGAFILCTFWLIDTLALSGRVAEAEKMLKNLLKYASPLGLLAEEIDIESGEQRGNFPQAFSHIGLINSALYIGVAKGRQSKQPKLLEVLRRELLETISGASFL